MNRVDRQAGGGTTIAEHSGPTACLVGGGGGARDLCGERERTTETQHTNSRTHTKYDTGHYCNGQRLKARDGIKSKHIFLLQASHDFYDLQREGKRKNGFQLISRAVDVFFKVGAPKSMQYSCETALTGIKLHICRRSTIVEQCVHFLHNNCLHLGAKLHEKTNNA